MLLTSPKKHPTVGGAQARRPAWTDTLSDDVVEPIIDELFLLGQLPLEIESVSRHFCDEFLYWMIADVRNLRTVSNIREYYEACKERYKDLSELCKLLLTAGTGQIHVSRIDQTGTLRNYLLGKRNRRVSITVVGNECYHTHRRPKVYGCLLKFICESCAALEILFDQGSLDESGYDEAVRGIVLVATTLGKAYEDIRGGRAFEDSEYAAAAERMHVAATPLDKGSRWYDLFNAVKEDILSDRPPRYVRDLAKIRRTEMPQYSYEDYSLSFKKTGSSYKHKSMPGLYAAMFELDHANCDDDLIGYVSHYNKVLVPDATVHPRKSIMIKQHKLDYRLIHLAENAIQDRASYYHRILASGLRQLRTDCTFNQNKGKIFAQKVTSPEFIREHKNNVYCLDISKATDTLNLEFQRMCMALVIPEAHVANWSNIMTGEAELIQRRGKTEHCITRFVQEVGQPQGLKSSFPAFALVHHIVMRMVMKANGLEREDPQQFYRVLGDDSIISWPDESKTILRDYRECCSFIGWKTNEKGYIYTYGEDEGAYAEFAKVRFLDGRVTTPIPIRLLTNSVKSESAEFALLTWYSEHVRRLSTDEVVYTLNEHWGLSEEKQIGLIFLQPIEKTEFSKFSMDWEGIDPDPGVMQLAYLAYTWIKIKHTLLNQFIPDDLLDQTEEFKEGIVDPFLRSKEEKMLLNLVEDPDNKYIQMLQRNEDLINALGELFGPISEGIGALHLADEEKESVYQFCEMIMDLKYTGPLPVNVWRPICDRVCEILGKYSPRSKILESRQSGEVLEAFEKSFKQLRASFTASKGGGVKSEPA